MTRVLIVVAREYEASAVTKCLRMESSCRVGPFERTRYNAPKFNLDVVVGDVGPVPASVATTMAVRDASYDLVVSAGIAGAFAGRADIGDLVMATDSVLADLGTETVGGRRSGLDAGWPDRVECLRLKGDDERRGVIRGQILTMSLQSGHEQLVSRVASAFPNAVAEAMEGAGVGLAAAYLGLPFVEVRAVSNLVGIADRDRWDKGAALDALSAVPELLQHVALS